MKGIFVALCLPLLIFLVSCKKDSKTSSVEFEFDFNNGVQGWNMLFSDYPVGEETFYELSFTHANLPAPLDQSKRALRVNGNNHSDDLLSMVYKKLDGLLPKHKYKVSFEIDIASNTCSGCAGAGGGPDISLGAGGLDTIPGNEIESSNPDYYRPNFSSAIQSNASNEVLKVVGNIGVAYGTNIPFMMKSLDNRNSPIELTTNGLGQLWILVGTDSGFEGITTIYYTRIKVVLTP